MKNRNAQAQILSETLDQIREDLLLQAHDVDTAEKFHALNGKMAVAVVKDRPVTVFHKAVAIAVSLAVAAALAFGVTALVRQFPGIRNPGPTDPHMTQPPTTTQTDPTTEPTQTTIPTEPTEPTNPTEPTEPTAPTEPDVPNPAGTCGENATWEFDPTTGTLTISGNGDMEDMRPSPWMDYRDQIYTLVIEPGITSIGSFQSLRYLTAVQIPDSVLTIQEEAFRGCRKLTTITLPESITVIGDMAFDSCGSLQTIQLPSGITEISFGLFSGCRSLKTITLPESITSIKDYAFDLCDWLTEIHIPDSVTYIGDHAFRNCWQLQSVTIGSSVQTIGSSAFSECRSLTQLQIPGSVTEIGDNAFWYCNTLQAVYFLGNIPSMTNAFSDTQVLTIYYPVDNETWTQKAIDDLSSYNPNLQFVPADENSQPVNP